MNEVKTYPTWSNRPQLLQSWPWLTTLRDLQRLSSSQIRTQLASSRHSYDWGTYWLDSTPYEAHNLASEAVAPYPWYDLFYKKKEMQLSRLFTSK